MTFLYIIINIIVVLIIHNLYLIIVNNFLNIKSLFIKPSGGLNREYAKEYYKESNFFFKVKHKIFDSFFINTKYILFYNILECISFIILFNVITPPLIVFLNHFNVKTFESILFSFFIIVSIKNLILNSDVISSVISYIIKISKASDKETMIHILKSTLSYDNYRKDIIYPNILIGTRISDENCKMDCFLMSVLLVEKKEKPSKLLCEFTKVEGEKIKFNCVVLNFYDIVDALEITQPKLVRDILKEFKNLVVSGIIKELKSEKISEDLCSLYSKEEKDLESQLK